LHIRRSRRWGCRQFYPELAQTIVCIRQLWESRRTPSGDARAGEPRQRSG
jgi:hypothetical protein